MARDNGATPGYTAPTSADYYVSPTGSDAADGSFATPFKTIRKAASELSGTPGGTIAVRGGVYRQSESLNALTFSSLLRIHRYGNEVPVFSGAEVLTGIAPCTIDDQSFLGANWSNCYKADIPAGSLNPSIPPEALNLHEAGNLMMLAVDRVSDEDAAFVDDIHAYHTASNFNDSGGSITQITAASVLSKYTSAQLVGAIASVYTNNNWVENREITGFNGTNTITIAATSGARYASSARWLFCLKNIGANIKQGGWAFKPTLNGNGSRTVYIWPNDPGNISGGIEFSARTSGIDLANCSNVKIDGLTVTHQAGTSNLAFAGIGKLQNSTSSTSNIEITECVIKGMASRDLGYGGVFLEYVSNVKVHKNTFDTFVASNPILVRFSQDVDITNNYLYRFNSTPIRIYSSDRVFWAWNEHEYGGRMVHANKIEIYISNDKVAAYANGFTDTYGYATHQQSSNVAFIFNRIDADARPAYADVPPGNYSFNDQNGGGEPDPGGKLILLNNSFNPNPASLSDDKGTYIIGAHGGNLDVYDINNTSNGGGDSTPGMSKTVLRKNNILTKMASYQNLDPSDLLDTDLSDTWQDAPGGNFTPTPGGNIYTKAGYDASSVMAFVQSWFPTKDFSLDYNGNPIDWNNAFVSSFNPAAVSGDVIFTAVAGHAVAMGSVASTNLDAGDQPYSTWGFGSPERLENDVSPLSGSSTTGTGFIYFDFELGSSLTPDTEIFVSHDADFSNYMTIFVGDFGDGIYSYIEPFGGGVDYSSGLIAAAGTRARVLVEFKPDRHRIWANQVMVYDSGPITATWKFNSDIWNLIRGVAGNLYQIGLWQTSIDPSNPAAWSPFYDAVSGDAKPLADARAAYGQPIFQIGGDDYNARKEDNDQSGRGNDFGYDGQSIFMQAAAGEAVAIGSVADAVQSAPVQFYAVDSNTAVDQASLSYGPTPGVAMGPDSSKMTISFWYNPVHGITIGGRFIQIATAAGNLRLDVYTASSDRLVIVVKNSAGADLVSVVCASPSFIANTWHHIGIAIDVTTPGNEVLHVLINGVQQGYNVSTVVSGVIDVSNMGRLGILRATDGSGLNNASIADVYVNTQEFVDISDPAGLAKFYNAGKQVYLGLDGSIPTGNQPALYFNGPLATFGTNKGYAGGANTNGTFINAASLPGEDGNKEFDAVAAQAVATGSVASYTVTGNVIADAVAAQAVAQGSVANAHYTENVEVNASPALAIATGSIPTFTKTDNVIVDAVAGQAIVIGSTPTYHITDNKTFTAVAGEAVAAGSVPTYELTGNYYATAVAAEAVAIGSVADSNASNDLTFTAIAGEAVATGSVADVEVTGNIIFNAVAGEAIAQGSIADFIATGNIVVNAVAANAVAKGAIAEWTATENHYYTAAAAQAVANGSVASYNFTENYHATAVAGETITTGSTPTYTLTQNVTMTANPALAIAYGSVADVQITSFIEPVIDAGVLYSYDFMITVYARY